MEIRKKVAKKEQILTEKKRVINDYEINNFLGMTSVWLCIEDNKRRNRLKVAINAHNIPLRCLIL